MDKKGQVSMEFIISVLAVLLVFVFCFGIFAERSSMNNYSVEKWSGENVVASFARNINNVYLLDNNSSVCEYIYWNEPNQHLELGGRTVAASMDDSYSDASLVTNNIIWGITDVNGLICFSKRNDFVYVGYR